MWLFRISQNPFHQSQTPERVRTSLSKFAAIPSPEQSKLHSLIIGIDNYAGCPSLNCGGAVHGANDMANFLMSDLNVPAQHITKLCNGEANRRRILEEFQALWNNPNIAYGDPILIYYSGRSGLAEASKEWNDRYGSKEIQVIFSADYQPESTMPVHPIPDQTIVSLLNELAAKKGDNITVIFDAPYGPIVLDRSRSPYVLLAACDIYQSVSKEHSPGVFTTMLLKEIRKSRIDNITYHNLILQVSLGAPGYQTPRCYGNHKHRILFNSRIFSRNIAFIPVSLCDGLLILAAGDASGVTVGSIWELYELPTEDSLSIGKFKVQGLYPSTATLSMGAIESYIGSPGGIWYARCMQIGPGNELKVWMSSNDRQLLFQDDGHLGGAHETGIGYVVTSTRNSADIALEVHYPDSIPAPADTVQPEVVFYWCDNLAVKYGTTQLKHRKPARRDEVETVLFAAARWRWHLGREKSQSRLLEQEVTMSMLKMGDRVGRRRIFLQQPEPVPVNADGVVELVIESSALYGFKLDSEVNSSLHVRMFYFDAADFSIGDMFGHGNKFTPDILPRAQLLIGDGADGGIPIKFSVPPGDGIELGYMKVFWSTEPLELDHMEQRSVFKGTSYKMGIDVKRDNMINEWEDTIGEWGTVCLALVLREHPAISSAMRADEKPVILETHGCREYPKPKPTISSSMCADEIMAILETHGCQNLTDQLELDTVGTYPVCGGGYGNIYTGQLHGSKVAIKTARLQRNPDKHSLKETAKELYTFLRCRHPNILGLLGLVAFQEQIGIVTAWLENGDVRKYLLIRPETDRCQLCHGISDGLAHMHNAGIVHGDLKGANVLISDTGIPMLSDFGNAVPNENSLVFTKSNTGANMTLRWTAPEILAATSSCSYAADVYALGMTWLEIITGQVPFHEIRNDISLLHPIVNQRRVPTRPVTHIPNNSRDGDALWGLMLKCWAYMPEDRPSADESRDSIKKITGDGLTES